jgi:cyclopropane-fatty-acyl-phospholipid synthase
VEREALVNRLIEALKQSPVALTPEAANRQHYELPPELFTIILGPYRKYSCCLWEPGTDSLKDAECTMLELTCQRAEIRDGMKILDLGCGWGALSIWVASRYPGTAVTAVTNSMQQAEFIATNAASMDIPNLQVVHADVQNYQTDASFDRVVSIEMFEHVRNFAVLLRRIAGWMNKTGRLFVHHFCHRDFPYTMEADDPRDWMARHFFTGGLMPSADLLARFQDDLQVSSSWTVSGLHYARTLRTWLENMDACRDEVMVVMRGHYGMNDARMWFNRWRMFFMACEELFAYRDGTEWFVVHHLFGHE